MGGSIGGSVLRMIVGQNIWVCNCLIVVLLQEPVGEKTELHSEEAALKQKMAGMLEYEAGLYGKLEARVREVVRQEYQTAIFLAEERCKAREEEYEDYWRILNNLCCEIKKSKHTSNIPTCPETSLDNNS